MTKQTSDGRVDETACADAPRHSESFESGPSGEVEVQMNQGVDKHGANQSAGSEESMSAVDLDAVTMTPDALALELSRVQEQLLAAETLNASLKDEALRIKADAQNMIRRAERDVENAHKYALERFVLDLLPVVDSLERGLEAVPLDDPALQACREGMVLTHKMFGDSLQKFNVEPVDPVGQVFDPKLHQAMGMQPSAEVPPNTVIAMLQKGYVLNQRLIRPALVMVSKAP